jgi:hypothetical protein
MFVEGTDVAAIEPSTDFVRFVFAGTSSGGCEQNVGWQRREE